VRAFLGEVRAYLTAPLIQPRISLIVGYVAMGAVAFITMHTAGIGHFDMAYVGAVIFAFTVAGLAVIGLHVLGAAVLHVAVRRRFR